MQANSATLKNNRGGQNDVSSTNGKILKNGMILSLKVFYVRDMGGVFGEILVDINGLKLPNRYGYDFFTFMYYVNGDVRPWNKKKGEQNSSEKYGADSCSTSTNYSFGCAYWVIKHNNMDYKYRDVSAEW